MFVIRDDQRRILSRLTSRLLNLRAGTPVMGLRKTLGPDRSIIDELVSGNLVRIVGGNYLPTFRGIENLEDDIRGIVRGNLECVFKTLQTLYRGSADAQYTFRFESVVEEAKLIDPTRDAHDVLPALLLGEEFGFYYFQGSIRQDHERLTVETITVHERIFDFKSVDASWNDILARDDAYRASIVSRASSARMEAERLAADAAKAKLERIVRDFGEERYRVVSTVAHSGNAGGYLPALIKWAVEHIRAIISAQADAYIEAFNGFNLPCDEAVERKVLQSASEFAAGSIANVRGDRFIQKHHLGLESPWHLKLEQEMDTSVKEAIVRLRRQSAMIRNRRKEITVNQTFNTIGPNSRTNINSTDNSTNVVQERPTFAELRKALESGISPSTERAQLLEKLAALEKAVDPESASQRFQAFVGAAADYMTIVGPFLPALEHWVHNLAAFIA